MARKPVHLQASGKLQPRERVWAAIRALKEFTRDDLFAWCAKHAPKDAVERCIHKSTIASYAEVLEAGKYLVVTAIAPGRYRKKTWRLARDVGAHAPRVDRQGREVTAGEGFAQLWNGMRRLKCFDRRDLIAAAAMKIAQMTAKNYCSLLRKAGYLEIDAPSKPGMPARYRLVRDTGPRAPVIQRTRHVYDPNLGKVVWHPQVNS